MRNVKDCGLVKEKRSETLEATNMKRLLCRIGKRLGFMVDVEEPPKSELGSLGIRHDVLRCAKPPDWHTRLVAIIGSREDLPGAV